MNVSTSGTAPGFLRGTRIVTANGGVPIEALRAGDLVAARSAGLVPVVRIGRQSFEPGLANGNQALLPVHITAGALGEGLPVHDLFVAPAQTLLADGVSIPARNLVNGTTITQAPDVANHAGGIEYFQLELPAQDCVMAEGCWSESFTESTGGWAQRHDAGAYAADAGPGHAEANAPPPAPEPEPEPEPELKPEIELEISMATAPEQAGTPPAPGQILGWIDNVSAMDVHGWAVDLENLALPVALEIWAGPRRIGETLASTYRADLDDPAKRGGHCAFFFIPAAPLSLAEQLVLQVRRAGQHGSLPMAEGCQAQLAQAAQAAETLRQHPA